MDQLRFDVTRCFSQGREQQSGVKAMSNLCTRELKFCDDDDDDDGKSRCSNKQQNYNTKFWKSDNYEYEMYVWNVEFWAGMTHALTQCDLSIQKFTPHLGYLNCLLEILPGYHIFPPVLKKKAQNYLQNF